MLWVLTLAAAGAQIECWEEFEDISNGAVDVPLFDGGAVQVATGEQFSCAIDADDDTVRCWGTESYTTTPPYVPADLGPVSAIAAGYEHVCVIPQSGGYRCWGGQSGAQEQVVTDLSAAVTDIACGVSVTCIRKTADQTVECYGPDFGVSLSPPNSLGAASAIDGGVAFACAIRESDDSVQCWGYNAPDTSSLPAAAAIAAGDGFVCAISRLDGAVSCSGATVPSNLEPATHISALKDPICIIGATTGTVTCWYGSTGTLFPRQPDPLGIGIITDVVPARTHICAMSESTTTPSTTPQSNEPTAGPTTPVTTAPDTTTPTTVPTPPDQVTPTPETDHSAPGWAIALGVVLGLVVLMFGLTFGAAACRDAPPAYESVNSPSYV